MFIPEWPTKLPPASPGDRARLKPRVCFLISEVRITVMNDRVFLSEMQVKFHLIYAVFMIILYLQ